MAVTLMIDVIETVLVASMIRARPRVMWIAAFAHVASTVGRGDSMSGASSQCVR